MQYTTAMMKQSMGGGVSDQSAAEDAAWELAELASMLSSSLYLGSNFKHALNAHRYLKSILI